MKFYLIGETFENDGNTLKVVKQLGCKGCYQEGEADCLATEGIANCSAMSRIDETSVIFEEVKR